ncbi:MAG TPA: Stp1/IreP family PP2C-type Ser/Thr phosphatase [Nitrosopumilus sp.]|nr:Stp1/IreP family PP2C-type Ser/Thr phosphatase [Nitrosopumilus sp.]
MTDNTNSRKIGMITDVGRVRTIDEDSILVADLSFGINSENEKFLLLAVADGMGGHAKGEEASKIALNTLTKSVVPELFGEKSFTELLENGIKNANQEILDYTSKNPESSGMGTTTVCALVKGNNVHLANVGDSRAYVISNDEIRRVTKDHSYVQALIDEGKITEEEARKHPQKNVITKAVGIMESVEPDTMKFTLDNDESLLLCCDGVIAHLHDEDIHEIIRDADHPQNACQQIVDLANERGGTDNISLIILSPKNEDKTTDESPTMINNEKLEE